MKNKRLSKILVLVLSLVLLLGSIAAVSVSAEETDNYEILGMNVVHGDQTYVILAVDASAEDAAAGNVTVSYTVGGETLEATYWAELTADAEKNPYDGAPIFFTKGISPKDVGETITAKAYKAGTDGEGAETKNVSVDLYLYRMLYRKGYADATDAEGAAYKGLYQNHIEYASYAQEVLWNIKPENAEKQRVLVSDKIYVYAAEATINGTTDVDVLLDAAGSVTLTPAEGLGANVTWVVKTYNANGTVTETQSTSNTIAVTGPTVIEAINPNMITFEAEELGTRTGNIYFQHNGKNRFILTTNEGKSNVEIIEHNGSKAIKFLGSNAGVNISKVFTADDANATVFEADMTVYTDGTSNATGYKPLMLDWRSVGGTERRHLYMGNIRGRSFGADAGTTYPERFDYILLRDMGGYEGGASVGGGTYYGAINNEAGIDGWPVPETADEEFDITKPYIGIGETFKLRMEYYWAVTEGEETVGKIKIYLNGAHVTTIDAPEVASVGGMNEIRMYSSQSFIMDNIVYEQVKLTY